MGITSKTSLVPATSQPSPSVDGNAGRNVLPDLMNYDVAEEKIQKLLELSTTNEVNSMTRRELRNIEVDVEVERNNGRLAADEMYTPVRLANKNIEREQGKYVAYLKQPQRAAFFYPVENPAISTELLAMDFTKRFRYVGWDQPFYRNVDRFQTHGWSVMEVQYDVSKPGRFFNDDVMFEDFLMPNDAREVQTNEMVGRIFHKTRTQLEQMIQSHGFVAEEIDKVCEDDGGTVTLGMEQTLHRVQKIFFRVDGVVQVAWSCHGKCSGWLRGPQPFHNGVINPDGSLVYEENYPFVLFPYKVSENQKITDLKGRVFYDEYQQEAATSLQSNFCTAHRRASAPYFSRDDDNPGGEQIKNITITPLAVIPSKVKAFQLAVPDPGMLSAIQALITQSSEDSGNINYAANNRVDSRKTATEIQSAQGENALLATTQTSLFSGAMSQLLAMDWRIFSSQVLAGLIKVPVNPQYYALEYVISPAGDIEVVARQEKIANMKQSWPVVQQTAIANEFLKRLLSLLFPEDAPVYNAMLVDDETKVKLIVSLWQLVSALAIDPHTGQPEAIVAPYLPQLQQLGQQVQQLTGAQSPFEQTGQQQGNKPKQKQLGQNNEQQQQLQSENQSQL